MKLGELSFSELSSLADYYTLIFKSVNDPEWRGAARNNLRKIHNEINKRVGNAGKKGNELKEDELQQIEFHL